MNGLQSHRWKSMRMNSIHHVTMSNIGIFDTMTKENKILIEFKLET
jgi:hypothetical protein